MTYDELQKFLARVEQFEVRSDLVHHRAKMANFAVMTK